MTQSTRRFLLIGMVLACAAVVIAWTAIDPSADREWIPEQARLPEVTIRGSAVHIDNIRDNKYRTRHDFVSNYVNKDYDLDKLVSVWYVLSPFSEGWRGPAHSFVSFGFSDSQFVAISVEARRESGEEYHMLKGVLKRYEIMYVVGNERDLIGQRAAFGDPVYLYPIRANPENIRAMFVSMIERANKLRTVPEFYNTVTNNCTSNVVAHVNQVAPRTVSQGLKVFLPGYSDEVAHQLGLIETGLDITAARQRFRVNAKAKRFINDSAFSVKIREAGDPP